MPRQGDAMIHLLLPVGTPGGINSGFDGMPDGYGIVRLGEEVIVLDESLYRLWLASAATPEVEELVKWGGDHGIPDVEALIKSLEDAELLIASDSKNVPRLGRLTLHLTGECLGNGADRGSKFSMRGRDGIEVDVDLYLFELLLRSDGVSAIESICDVLDKARPELARRPLVEALFDGLPVLVRSGVVRLDAAVR